MGGIAGISHQRAVRALERAGFAVMRQGKHISMRKDRSVVTIPRQNPIDAYTMAGIVRDAGLTAEQFRKLL
jgi:predicted RNA binding protein YcfA (HicA-like mRNA interferase family)